MKRQSPEREVNGSPSKRQREPQLPTDDSSSNNDDPALEFVELANDYKEVSIASEIAKTVANTKADKKVGEEQTKELNCANGSMDSEQDSDQDSYKEVEEMPRDLYDVIEKMVSLLKEDKEYPKREELIKHLKDYQRKLCRTAPEIRNTPYNFYCVQSILEDFPLHNGCLRIWNNEKEPETLQTKTLEPKELQTPQTKEPETKEPETKELQTPQTKEPETKAQETKAQETKAQETTPKNEEIQQTKENAENRMSEIDNQLIKKIDQITNMTKNAMQELHQCETAMDTTLKEGDEMLKSFEKVSDEVFIKISDKAIEKIEHVLEQRDKVHDLFVATEKETQELFHEADDLMKERDLLENKKTE